MRRRFIFLFFLILLPVGALVSGWALSPGPERAIDCRNRVWSDTRPAINLTHIFAGEINRRANRSAFIRGPGTNPPGSGVVHILKT